MKFLASQPDRAESVPERIALMDCELGEVYECCFSFANPQDYPATCDLRLCIRLDDGCKALVNLLSGKIAGTNDGLSQKFSHNQIYIHRPDVKLAFGE